MTWGVTWVCAGSELAPLFRVGAWMGVHVKQSKTLIRTGWRTPVLCRPIPHLLAGTRHAYNGTSTPSTVSLYSSDRVSPVGAVQLHWGAAADVTSAQATVSSTMATGGKRQFDIIFIVGSPFLFPVRFLLVLPS